MSRCFPFPPPGYERKMMTNSKVSDDEASLIESIKKEQAKAEKESRKEKKREKKEKKKKEKEEKIRLNGEVEKKKGHSHRDKGVVVDHKFSSGKQKQYENEQLERSGLSEEHGPPSSVPTLCDSSDSTQNSGKRKKPSSPIEGGSHNQSTMLRIRLPVARPKDSEEQPSKKQRTEFDVGPSISIKQSSSISSIRTNGQAQASSSALRANVQAHASSSAVRTNVQAHASSSAVRTNVQAHASSSAVRTNVQAQASGSIIRVGTAPGPVASVKQCISISGRPKGPMQDRFEPTSSVWGPSTSTMPSSFVSGRSDAAFQDRSEYGTGSSLGPSSSMKQSLSISEPAPAVVLDPSKLSLSEISSLSTKQLRRALENWVPPVAMMDCSDFDDQDWLFDLPAKRPSKVSTASCLESTVVTSSWPPRACYMPEVDMYALPYTVPF